MTTTQRPLEKTHPDLLWQAVLQRDSTYNGSVIYAVRTTRHLPVARPVPAADPIEPTLDSLLIPKMPSRRATEPACAASQTGHSKKIGIAAS